jgi:hypothetical protein
MEYIWFSRAAKLMIREGKTFGLAVEELEIPGMSPKEQERLLKSEGFQAVLRAERHKYANEIANDPKLGKSTAIGMMMLAIERLMHEGEWDKALEGLQKLSKLTGWAGPESQVTVFADLKGKEIEDLKRQIGNRTSGTSIKESLN